MGIIIGRFLHVHLYQVLGMLWQAWKSSSVYHTKSIILQFDFSIYTVYSVTNKSMILETCHEIVKMQVMSLSA
jgi:hypothetical protein